MFTTKEGAVVGSINRAAVEPEADETENDEPRATASLEPAAPKPKPTPRRVR